MMEIQLLMMDAFSVNINVILIVKYVIKASVNNVIMDFILIKKKISVKVFVEMEL